HLSGVTLGKGRKQDIEIIDSETIKLKITDASSGLVSVHSVAKMVGSRGSFKFIAPPSPQISDFHPKQATLGETVYITGTNFFIIRDVFFDSVKAMHFEIIDSTKILAVVGRTKSGSIRVTDDQSTSSMEGFSF